MPLPAFSETIQKLPVNGLQMQVYQSGPTDGTPLIFLHGFPQIAYAWRHQLDGLSQLGYRAIAPDLRGYGETGGPDDIDLYCLEELLKDMGGLLQQLAIPQAVFVGHDMGSMLAYAVRQVMPEHCLGVASLNLPIVKRKQFNPIEQMCRERGAAHYMVQFQKRPDPEFAPFGLPEERLEHDVARTLGSVLRTTGHPPSFWEAEHAEAMAQLPIDVLVGEPRIGEKTFLTPAELDAYVETYEATGFTGGINWYRNLGRNWRDARDKLAELRDTHVSPPEPAGQHTPVADAGSAAVPILLIRGNFDPVTRATRAAWMINEAGIPNLRVHDIDCGHFTAEEAPEEVNTTLHAWIQEVVLAPPPAPPGSGTRPGSGTPPAR